MPLHSQMLSTITIFSDIICIYICVSICMYVYICGGVCLSKTT